MDTLKEYIKMRNAGEYNLNWFYNYFIENSGKSVNMDIFGHVFNMQNLSEILNFLDQKFKLNKLESKDGTFVKILE